MTPKIVAAHGTAVAGRQSKPGLTLSKLIHDAQVKAILECHTAGITDPALIAKAKNRARDAARTDWILLQSATASRA